MFCTNCATIIEKGNFCPNCGTPVSNQVQTQPQKQMPNQAPDRQSSARFAGNDINYIPSAPTETGIANPKPAVPIYADPSLPPGMYRDEEGYIRWILAERDYTRFFFMDEKRVGYIMAYPPKEQSISNIFIKDGLKTAAGIITADSDITYGTESSEYWNPSDYKGGIGGFKYLSFERLKRIKANQKKNTIELKVDFMTQSEIVTSPQHFQFVLDYIIRHSPNAAVK